MSPRRVAAGPYIALAVLGLAVVVELILLALVPGARAGDGWRRRPAWPLMLADIDYFRKALERLFSDQGYAIQGYWVHQGQQDETAREVVFALERGGTHYAALCVRWVVPVTSEVIAQFEQALAATGADEGVIVTTSIFTQGALERARGLPVELYDWTYIQNWIEQGRR
jgi:HJR/Mrr/RecB family endonuclease